jgi:hypothetical protein
MEILLSFVIFAASLASGNGEISQDVPQAVILGIYSKNPPCGATGCY